MTGPSFVEVDSLERAPNFEKVPKRPDPLCCRYEPTHPGITTVTFAWSRHDMVIHTVDPRCQADWPHPIWECNMFDWGKGTSAVNEEGIKEVSKATLWRRAKEVEKNLTVAEGRDRWMRSWIGEMVRIVARGGLMSSIVAVEVAKSGNGILCITRSGSKVYKAWPVYLAGKPRKVRGEE